MSVNTVVLPGSGLFDAVTTELTEAAYSVSLRHRTVASSADLKRRELWTVISETLQSMGQGLFWVPGGIEPRATWLRCASRLTS